MSKFVNTESFILKAKKLHGEVYDYSKVVYKGTKDKVIIICRTHGEFTQTPSNHYQFGCSQCGFELRGIKKRLSGEEAVKTLLIKHDYKYNYPNLEENYVTTKDKIEISCKRHGVFKQKYENHLTGQGCPYCRYSGDDGLTTIYLCRVSDFSRSAIKVGITSEVDPMVRLKHLTRVDKELILNLRVCSKAAVILEARIKKEYCSGDCFFHEKIKGEFFKSEFLVDVLDLIIKETNT